MRNRISLRRASGPGAGNRLAEPDRGSTAVELAILMPAILIALFASIQVATWFMARSVALSAAQQGVTAQRVEGAPAGAGTSRAQQFLAGAGDWLAGATITVNRNDANEVQVTVTGNALSIIPGVQIPVSQTAHGTKERFTTEAAP